MSDTGYAAVYSTAFSAPSLLFIRKSLYRSLPCGLTSSFSQQLLLLHREHCKQEMYKIIAMCRFNLRLSTILLSCPSARKPFPFSRTHNASYPFDYIYPASLSFQELYDNPRTQTANFYAFSLIVSLCSKY